MLFNSIRPLMQGNKAVTITVSQAENGQMTVTILPVRNTAAQKQGVEEAAILSRPFIQQGTPDELDASFFDKLGRYAGGYRKVADQLDETLELMDQAAKSLKAKGVKASKKADSAGPEKLELDESKAKTEPAPSASLPASDTPVASSSETESKPKASSDDFDLNGLF